MKKVTAVLPARNCRRQLHRCLLALHAGTCVPEIIVVDDGSEDGTAEMIRAEWPAVTLLTLSAHTGFAHASNAGLRLVRTEYAFLLRPDLRAGRSCVERLFTILQCREDAFCAVPAFSIVQKGHSGAKTRSEYESRGKRKPGTAADRAVRTLAVPDGCALYRMSVLEEIGWFDERLYDGLEALDLSLRAALYGYSTLRVPGARVRRNPQECAIKAPEEQAGQTVPQAAGCRRDLFHRQLAMGNRRYICYKYLPWMIRIPAFPLLTAVEAAEALSLIRSGQGGACRMAVTRGRALCGLERMRRRAPAEGTAVPAETLPDAAFLGMEEAASRIYPLFLAEKESFSASMLPEYAQIGGLLLKEIASGRFFGTTV